MNHQPDVSARPLIIGGMHRSGTSLTASLFASAGIDLGPRLLGRNASNPLGHFEDLDFHDFHARALVAQGLGSEGYTTSGRCMVPATLVSGASRLLAERMRPGVAWGWKEPRTTLFLDFWEERLPGAPHVFVFRPPWEVADSLFRRGDETFILNPTFALDVWTHYNRLIVDFVRRHPTSCMVFDIGQVIADPSRVIAAVRSRFDLPLDRPLSRYREDMFTRDPGPSRAAIVRSLAPEAWTVYRALCELADTSMATPVHDVAMADCVVLEWARASRAETQARQTAEQATRLQAEVEARVQIEVESRLQAAEEARLKAENEAQLQASVDARPEAKSRRRRRVRRSIVAVWRGSGATLRRLAAATRRLLRRPRPEGAMGAPDLRPFPRTDDAPATQRAA